MTKKQQWASVAAAVLLALLFTYLGAHPPPWNQVSTGMSFQQVYELLGRPREFSRCQYAGSMWESWEWSNYDWQLAHRKAEISAWALLVYLDDVEVKQVTFCNGRVISKDKRTGGQ